MEKAVPWKYLLTRIGSLLPPKAIYEMNASLNYLEVGRWMHAHGYNVAHRVDHRTKLFDLVGLEVADRVGPLPGVRRPSGRGHPALVQLVA